MTRSGTGSVAADSAAAASAEWGNMSSAFIGYSGQQSGQIEAAIDTLVERIAAREKAAGSA